MPDDPTPDSFDRQARGPRPGLLGELSFFLRTSRKWWLLPILAGILALGLLAALAGSPAAPFIYTLF